jgi:hypothetical protein
MDGVVDNAGQTSLRGAERDGFGVAVSHALILTNLI